MEKGSSNLLLPLLLQEWMHPWRRLLLELRGLKSLPWLVSHLWLVAQGGRPDPQQCRGVSTADPLGFNSVQRKKAAPGFCSSADDDKGLYFVDSSTGRVCSRGMQANSALSRWGWPCWLDCAWWPCPEVSWICCCSACNCQLGKAATSCSGESYNFAGFKAASELWLLLCVSVSKGSKSSLLPLPLHAAMHIHTLCIYIRNHR